MGKAKETAQKAFSFVRDKWGAANRNARIVTLAVAGAMVVALITLAALGSRTEFEVLYTGVSNEESGEIAAALSSMGITNVRLSGQSISVPRETVDRARMQLAIEGFPKSTYNYNIWNEGVGMFSTDAERKEIQRQQLQEHLRATLRSINDIQEAIVNIGMAEDQRFVLPSTRDVRQAKTSVLLTLRQGVRLSDAQIEGIHRLVLTSVPDLVMENLSITTQDGMPLIADDAGSAETRLIIEMQRHRMQTEFQRNVQEGYKQMVESLLHGTVRDYRVTVSAQLDFSDWQSHEERFHGPNVDENGFQHGILDHNEARTAWNTYGEEGGLVGTTTNADISPDYPTWTGEFGSEQFYENYRFNQYLVDRYEKTAQANGFSIAKLTVAVQIDEGAIPQDEIALLEQLIAHSVSTDTDNVTVRSTNFTLMPPTPPIIVPVPSPVRNLLVFIIISLGALLIILFMLAIMSSGSKKRRLIRARAAAYQGIGGGTPSFDDDGFGGYAMPKQVDEEPEEIKLQSLLGAGESETRDALLKNEIREFAKTNPDIVAQLIRTWIREP
jgi:flagellar M-ring protein FliF